MKHSNKIKTLDDAINANSNSIAKLINQYSEDFIIGWIQIWLIYINQMLNLRRSMTEDQIELSSFGIVSEFKSLKVSDLTLLTKRIINGEYGEFYESLSIAKVMTFFREYLNERLDKCAQQSLDKHNDQKQNLKQYNVSKNVERWYRGISDLSKH